MKVSVPSLFLLPALTLMSAAALSEAYHFISRLLAVESWQAALLLHSGLAVAVLAGLIKSKELRRRFSFVGAADSAPNIVKKAPALLYLPALIVLLGSGVMVLMSRQFGELSSQSYVLPPISWVLWVPLVEEIVFRVGFGSGLRRLGGAFWGGWFSAILFALVHASPTFGKLIHGEIGLPLGPFLLALVCEGLYGISGRIWPIVMLHAACNATVMIFVMGDQRWLRWLNVLYSG